MEMFIQRRIKKNSEKATFCMDLIARLYVCSLKGFMVSQLAYERLKDAWLTIDPIKLGVIYQMPVC